MIAKVVVRLSDDDVKSINAPALLKGEIIGSGSLRGQNSPRVVVIIVCPQHLDFALLRVEQVDLVLPFQIEDEIFLPCRNINPIESRCGSDQMIDDRQIECLRVGCAVKQDAALQLLHPHPILRSLCLLTFLVGAPRPLRIRHVFPLMNSRVAEKSTISPPPARRLRSKKSATLSACFGPSSSLC